MNYVHLVNTLFRRGAMWVQKFAAFNPMCVLSQIIYRTTFCTLEQFASENLIAETCMATACNNNNCHRHNRC